MMDKLASLGIDLWSMVLYLLNTGVLLIALTYILYKPINKFLEKRQKDINDSIDEAQRLQEKFESELAKSNAEREKSEAELRDQLSKLQKFTEQKRAELLAEMEAARGAMMQKAQAEIDKKKENLIKDAEETIKEIMVKIILDIVENKVPENVISESIHSAWKKY